MPIRMEDDPQDQQQNDSGQGGRAYNPQGPGGGGGGLLGLLPLLLKMFRGKSLIFLLVIGGIGYFLMNRGGCSGAGGIMDNISEFTKGGFLDPKEFEKASIYEPLADDNSRNPLPEAANLQRFAPPVGNQGHQGSCVAWSSAYAARSILESTRTNQQQTVFSPSFLYNQIGLQNCEGSYLVRAMEYMTRQGSIPYQQFPYDENDCSTMPDRVQVQEASKYKMRGFTRLSAGDRNDAIDPRAIKENLAQGAPVVIGMMVGQSFMQNMLGKDLWIPEANDRSMMGFGGHAMCVVGYDDKKYG
ncbi:MAG: C1 family peptidase, partial [Chitinophagaceae bacterium]